MSKSYDSVYKRNDIDKVLCIDSFIDADIVLYRDKYYVRQSICCSANYPHEKWKGTISKGIVNLAIIMCIFL